MWTIYFVVFVGLTIVTPLVGNIYGIGHVPFHVLMGVEQSFLHWM